MALISMAIYDTNANHRAEVTQRTLLSLTKTVNWSNHRLVLIDNGSCQETKVNLKWWIEEMEGWQDGKAWTLITLPENIGTARAVNRGWLMARPDEVVVKMDNDIIIHYTEGWADLMEEAIRKDPSIGIVGLKRKDVAERPDHPDAWAQSQLYLLPHVPGEKWIVGERVYHVMGSCQAFSPALRQKIGFLYQGDFLYGFDDVLASVRAHVAGFETVFLPFIEIDHIDPPNYQEYADEKARYAGNRMLMFNTLKQQFIQGLKPLWTGPDQTN